MTLQFGNLTVLPASIVAVKLVEPYHPIQAIGRGWRVSVLLAGGQWSTLQSWPERSRYSSDDAEEAQDGTEARNLYDQLIAAIDPPPAKIEADPALIDHETRPRGWAG